MKALCVFKVVLALSTFFVGMEVAVSASPPSVKAQAATKKHSSFAGRAVGNTPQTLQKMPVQPLSSGENVTALRARIARGEELVERTLPAINTPRVFASPSARNSPDQAPRQ